MTIKPAMSSAEAVSDSTFAQGKDHVRTLSGTLIFDQAHFEHVVSIPNSDAARLEEVFLSIRGDHSLFASSPYVTAGSVMFRSPHDVRVSLLSATDGSDSTTEITPALVTAINKALAAEPRAGALYRRAAEYALERYRKSVALDSMYDDRALSRSTAAISANAVGPQIRALGDRQVGVEGDVDPFNFLYSDIPLPAIPLSALLAAKGKAELSRLSSPRLVFEHGRGDRQSGSPAGILHYTVEAIYHNALIDEFDDMRDRVTTALEDIQAKLDITGQLMQTIANTHDELLIVKTALDDFVRQLNSTIAEVTELKIGVGALGQKVDGLK
ncbi:MAG: hypothetical protein JO093_13730 [Acidobacteria bacterium]|nr:hypothetical protein [Acidobacteriota bacterium]MBV9068526.1 hypothetical protein [Acidobacteriota bacterium]MBV9186674.1 hypothetical protein [Acidobacteriota bacterium]